MLRILPSAGVAVYARRTLLALALAASAATLHAEALLSPLPQADTARLPSAVAKSLADTRAEFDAAKTSLIGVALAEAYVQIGAEYTRHGFDAVAAVAFENAAKLAPEDGRWRYLQGVMAQNGKSYGVARGHYEAALKLDPNYLPIRLRLADVLLEINDAAGAKKVLAEIGADRPEYASAQATLGEIALRERRYADAVTALELALKLQPQATRLYGFLADALQAQGETALAEAARKQAGDIRPAMADPLVSGLYSPKMQGKPIEQAVELMRLGRLEEARARIVEAFGDNPNDLVAMSVAARLEALTGNLEAARKMAANALQLAPDGALPHLSMGMVLEIAGSASEAATHYEQALRADLKLAEARLLLGNAHMRGARFTQAAEQYRQLVALQPNNSEALARLVAAQAADRQCAAAVKTAGDAQRSKPRDGGLVQVFVRAVSSCPTASAAERKTASELARALYTQLPDEAHCEALAQILAADGKFDDAVEYQAQAMFLALRAGDQIAVERYKLNLKRFEAKQAAAQPWPPGHAYATPAPLAVLPAAPQPKSAG